MARSRWATVRFRSTIDLATRLMPTREAAAPKQLMAPANTQCGGHFRSFLPARLAASHPSPPHCLKRALVEAVQLLRVLSTPRLTTTGETLICESMEARRNTTRPSEARNAEGHTGFDERRRQRRATETPPEHEDGSSRGPIPPCKVHSSASVSMFSGWQQDDASPIPRRSNSMAPSVAAGKAAPLPLPPATTLTEGAALPWPWSRHDTTVDVRRHLR